jgi:hypothetical protein
MAGTLEDGKLVGSGCCFEVGDQFRGGLQVKRNHPVHKAGPAISLDIGKLCQDLPVERRVAARLGYRCLFRPQGACPPYQPAQRAEISRPIKSG